MERDTRARELSENALSFVYCLYNYTLVLAQHGYLYKATENLNLFKETLCVYTLFEKSVLAARKRLLFLRKNSALDNSKRKERLLVVCYFPFPK